MVSGVPPANKISKQESILELDQYGFPVDKRYMEEYRAFVTGKSLRRKEKVIQEWKDFKLHGRFSILII